MGRMRGATVALLAAGLLAGCDGGGQTGAGPAGPDGPVDEFALFYTCDTRGYLEACACPSGVAGGLARRTTYLKKNRTGPALLLDAGDVARGVRDWDVKRLGYILKAYEKMGYDAVNAGHREAALSVANLRKIKANYPKFISANLADAEGETVFDPYRIFELGPNHRVAVLGVMADDLDPDDIGAGLKVTSPDDAIRRHLPDLRKKAEFVVLLAFAKVERLKAFTEQFFELDVVVGGKVEQPSAEPIESNRSVIVYVTNKGHSIGKLDVARKTPDKWDYKNDMTLLKLSMKEDKDILALIADYKKERKKMGRTEKDDDEGDEGLSSIKPIGSAKKSDGASSSTLSKGG